MDDVDTDPYVDIRDDGHPEKLLVEAIRSDGAFERGRQKTEPM